MVILKKSLFCTEELEMFKKDEFEDDGSIRYSVAIVSHDVLPLEIYVARNEYKHTFSGSVFENGCKLSDNGMLILRGDFWMYEPMSFHTASDIFRSLKKPSFPGCKISGCKAKRYGEFSATQAAELIFSLHLHRFI